MQAEVSPIRLSEVRSWVRSACEGRFSPDRCNDLVLIVTELTTNAMLYGAGPVDINITLDGDRLYSSVTDQGSGGVAKLAFSLTDEHGRGLRIVEALSDRWGVEWRPGEGTVVWSELSSR